jgi:hypothetical protein
MKLLKVPLHAQNCAKHKKHRVLSSLLHKIHMNQIKIASGKCIHDDNFSRRIVIRFLQIGLLMSQSILMSELKQQRSASR